MLMVYAIPFLVNRYSCEIKFQLKIRNSISCESIFREIKFQLKIKKKNYRKRFLGQLN